MGSGCSSAARVHAFNDADSVPVPALPKRLTGAFLGLSGAGKTTCIHTLARTRQKSTQPSGTECVITPAPTQSVKSGTIDLDAFTLTSLDLPGDEMLRDTWGPALKRADFIVLVVDCTSIGELPLAREALDETVNEYADTCPPVLVLANKLDKATAASVLDVVDALDMRTFDQAYWAIEGCSNLETPTLTHVRNMRQAVLRFAGEAFGAPPL